MAYGSMIPSTMAGVDHHEEPVRSMAHENAG